MKKGMMLCIAAVLLSGCVHCTSEMTVGEIKSGLTCVAYNGDLTWNQVKEVLGDADCFPRPEPGSQLTANTRVYEGSVVIFAVGLKEVEEGGKTRFIEGVTGIEVCRPR